MSEYDEGTDDNGVLDFLEIDDDIQTTAIKTDVPPISAKQDNVKRSSFVEKTRRISSENAGEIEDEVEDRAVSARTLATTASATEVVEESNYNDVDNDWEQDNGNIGNKDSSMSRTSKTTSDRGASKAVSPELDFPSHEVEEMPTASIMAVSSYSPSSQKAQEVEEVIVSGRGKVSAASSPQKHHSVLSARAVVGDDAEVEDIPDISEARAPPSPSPSPSYKLASVPAPVVSERAIHSKKNATQDADTRSVEDEHLSERGSVHGKTEHPKTKAPTEKRSTAAAKLADAAEKQALAAEQEKEDKIAALRQRAAKRQEEKEKRERKELLKQQRREREAADAPDGTDPTEDRGADGENDAGNELKGKLFLPNINNKVKKAGGLGKNRAQSAEEEGVEKNAAGWNDDVKADNHSDEVKERQQAVQQQRLKDKEERNRLLRARRAKAQAQDQQAAEGGTGGEGEEIPVESHNLIAPKPPVGRTNQQPGRAGRKVAGSANSVDDDYGRGVVLPHLNHPRSSPDPRAALHSLLQESEQIGAGLDLGGIADDNKSYNSSSNKARRRKPLYLRMIAKAQQQYLEDERQKHELYSEQKKSKQRGNPTAEELRAHRQKHDELVRNKQEEGKRALAEAAAANARAIKRQQAVASVVQTALDEGDGELVVDGASPNRKAKPQRRSKPSRNKDDGGGISLPALSDHGHTGGPGSNTRDNGFSPKKGSSSSLHSGHSPSKAEARSPGSPPSSSGRAKRSSTDPDEGENDSRFGIDSHIGITETGLFPDSTPRRPASSSRIEFSDSDKRPQRTVTMVSVGTDTSTDEPPQLPAPTAVPLEFDREAAAAAVRSIPDLDCDALTAYCGPDWMKIFSTVDDLVLVPGSRAEGGPATALVGGKQLFVRGIILGQAPPTLDAQKLMFIDEPITAEE